MILNTARALPFSLALWLITLDVPQLAYSDWETRQQLESGRWVYQFVGFALFVVPCLVTGMRRAINGELLRAKSLSATLLLGFFVAAAVGGLLGNTPIQSLAYCIATFLAFLCSEIFWKSDLIAIWRAFLVASIAIFTILILAWVMHGTPGGRTVGGITPNQYGKMAMTAMICSYVLPGRFKLIATGAALGLALLVSSRSTLVAIVAFIVFYTFVFAGGRIRIRWAVLALVGLILITLVVGMISMGVENALTSFLIDRLAVFDPYRGVGSGLTGRTELWAAGLTMIGENPFGLGFRSDRGGLETAHNGYLNLALDVGVPATLVFIIYIALRLKMLHRLERWAFETSDPTRRFYRVGGAMIATTLILWMSEPIYLNIGLDYSVLFIVFLSLPTAASLGREASYVRGVVQT